MTKEQTHTDLEQDLADDYTDGASTRRLNQFDARLHKLEQLMEAVRDELGEVSVTLSQTRETYARNNMAGEEAALNTLAKASNATKRRMTPESLLERAERVLTDPSAMGTVAGYIANGQLAKAADVLKDVEARADKETEDGALNTVESQIKEHEVLASVSQLGEQVADLQHGVNALLSRISKLEARSAAPAPVQTGATVTKVARFGKAPQDPRDTAQGLLTRTEGVVDSPAKIGHISSLIQAGQLDQARAIIEAAELQHETDVKKNARRGF
jgi:septation ring formation regulator EzrA